MAVLPKTVAFGTYMFFRHQDSSGIQACPRRICDATCGTRCNHCEISWFLAKPPLSYQPYSVISGILISKLGQSESGRLCNGPPGVGFKSLFPPFTVWCACSRQQMQPVSIDAGYKADAALGLSALDVGRWLQSIILRGDPLYCSSTNLFAARLHSKRAPKSRERSN
jgi:hypothetical protein